MATSVYGRGALTYIIRTLDGSTKLPPKGGYNIAKNKFYGYLLNIPEFKELVSKKIIKYETVVKSTIESECNNALKNESDSFERNFMKWGSFWERVITKL